MKKIVSILLLIAIFSTTAISCSNQPGADDGESGKVGDTTEGAENEGGEASYSLDIDEETLQRWQGEVVYVRTVDMSNATMQIDVEDISDDPVDLQVYYRTQFIEETMGIDLVDVIDADYYSGGFKSIQTLVQAGDDTYSLMNVRCIESISAWADGCIIMFDDLNYINLDKGYWAQDINPYLTLMNRQYIAVGAADINVYDFTFALLFNKELHKDLGLENIYELVDNGKWTIDKMDEMMQTANYEVNGDDKRDSNDRYGYLADTRMVLPAFWISSGTLEVYKDESDLPQLNFMDEKFIDVMNKVFEIMWDHDSWFSKYSGDYDVPSQCISMFSEGLGLFLDSSFRFVENLRSMETDFGIVPHPKWDEQQKQYYARVSYFFSLVVPMSCPDPDLSAVLLEVLQYFSAKKVIPAYYDQVLKYKYARDEESSAMLDIIFTHRVVDLGDTTYCDVIRDGLFADMFGSNNRNLSTVQKSMRSIDRRINKQLEKVIEEYGG
ncbi:MAG: hypothetical protein WBI55_07900 [Eubacteriales bacterium]|jgi:hypothetical protein